MDGAYRRLVSKLTKENLWLYVLSELKSQPMYAYEVAKVLKGKHAIPIATVTAYVVLYKLRKEGLIEEKTDKPSSRRPDRKYYAITGIGVDTLEAGKRFIEERLKSLS